MDIHQTAAFRLNSYKIIKSKLFLFLSSLSQSIYYILCCTVALSIQISIAIGWYVFVLVLLDSSCPVVYEKPYFAVSILVCCVLSLSGTLVFRAPLSQLSEKNMRTSLINVLQNKWKEITNCNSQEVAPHDRCQLRLLFRCSMLSYCFRF